jgi:hypothetical protein
VTSDRPPAPMTSTVSTPSAEHGWAAKDNVSAVRGYRSTRDEAESLTCLIGLTDWGTIAFFMRNSSGGPMSGGGGPKISGMSISTTVAGAASLKNIEAGGSPGLRPGSLAAAGPGLKDSLLRTATTSDGR